MNPSYTIKNYEKKDWQGISGLFKDVFGKEIKPQYFKWKNEDNPQGESIVKIAVREDKIIGLSCIWKFKMNVLGESIFAGQSVDAMVDSSYRRMGIFENMAIKAIEEMKNEGLQLRFNFPNEAAYQASINKVNIKKVCDIPQYIKILKGREAFGMFTGNKMVKLAGGAFLDIYCKLKKLTVKNTQKYDIREVQWIDHNFDRLWDNVKKDYPIVVERSSKYLNWRYFSSPQDYKVFAAYDNDEILGYIVVALEEKKSKTGEKILLGHIADLICRRDYKDAGKDLIIETEKYLKANGACAVSCWMIKEWFYSELLTKCAFLQLRSPSILAVLPLGEKIITIGDFVYDYKNWYITIGDSDYI